MTKRQVGGALADPLLSQGYGVVGWDRDPGATAVDAMEPCRGFADAATHGPARTTAGDLAPAREPARRPSLAGVARRDRIRTRGGRP